MAAVIEATFDMVSTHLFRTLPPDDRDNDSHAYRKRMKKPKKEDPAWIPRLEPIYKLLLSSLESSDSAIDAAKYVDSTFILNLLNLFDSKDHRERRYVRKVLICIYRRFQWLRPFIIKSVGNVFYTFVFETERHNGIAEILDAVGKIIDGFQSPTDGEDKLCLARALIPLHVPKFFSMYRKKLCKCIVLFLRKDCTKLVDPVFQGILKYWPLTNCSKEVFFLDELDKVVQVINPADLQLRVLVSLFRQISRCLNSFHHKVAKRALSLLKNRIFVEVIKQNWEVVLPMLIPALEKARSHWKGMVQDLALQVWNAICDIDPELFQKFLIKSNRGNEAQDQIRLKRETTWKGIEEIAAMDAIDGRREATWKHLEEIVAINATKGKQEPRGPKIIIRTKPSPKIIIRAPAYKRPLPKITICMPSGKRVKLNC